MLGQVALGQVKSCPDCAAVVVDLAQHDDYHAAEVEALEAVVEGIRQLDAATAKALTDVSVRAGDSLRVLARALRGAGINVSVDPETSTTNPERTTP